jgi:hypothetical protein
VLAAAGVSAPPTASDLDQPITSYAVFDDGELFAVAYYPQQLSANTLADTFRVRVLEKRHARWKYSALPTRLEQGAQPGLAQQLGSIVRLSRAGAYLYLDSHRTPSAGTLLVLDRELKPVAALNGWSKYLFPDGVVVYEQSAPHFAPTYSARLSVFDPASRSGRPLYPLAPYDSIRSQYIEEVARIYRGIGDSWFREHNHHMDPERFDSAVGETFVSNPAGQIAFLVQFGTDVRRPVTPVLEVVVHCLLIRTTSPQCSERRLSDLRRDHPGLSDRQILEGVVGVR